MTSVCQARINSFSTSGRKAAAEGLKFAEIWTGTSSVPSATYGAREVSVRIANREGKTGGAQSSR